jgi:hypothetical protein
MIQIQPDNASRGHLFGEFRKQLLDADPRGVMQAAGTKPARFYEPGFKASRQPDDVITVATGGDIPQGTWLGEDKAGKNAFDIDQLVDLAKLWDPAAGGIKRAAKDAAAAYKGEIFFFSERRWAANAEKDIANHASTSHLLDGDPPAVVLLYIDPNTGTFTRYLKDARVVNPALNP